MSRTEHWMAFPGKRPVCRDCGADWSPVRRGECVACGSDSGPLPTAPEPTSTLTDFLLARIAEDKADARQWTEFGRSGDCMECGGWSGGVESFDPARVLAECEAKRRIVEIANDQIRLGRQARGWDNWEDMAVATLRALALPYADHPDFREEWRP